MTAIICLVIIAGIVGIGLVMKSHKSNNTPVPTSGWAIQFSPGMPAQPTTQGSGWYFDFPTSEQNHINYLQWFSPPELKVGQTLQADFQITGGNFIAQQSPTEHPTVCLLLQRKGDNWGAIGPYASYRWYSKNLVQLAPGTYQLQEILNPSNWTNVSGQEDPIGFADCLSNLDNIGLVFGSPSLRGHGVYSTTSSRFQLQSLSIQD